MARILSSMFLIFVYQVLISTSNAENEQPNKPVSLFIFGDSFFDVGNNNYINTTTQKQANFWPYGQTYFNFPTGRFSDGRLISDFITEYANLPLIPPFLQPGFESREFFGVNFASSGAGALVETYLGYVIDLHTQLRYYKKVETWLITKLGYNEAKKMISEAIYLFSIGSNDYTVPIVDNCTEVFKPYSKFVDMVIGNITTVINEFYEIGGRRFAFVNLPSLGCLPAMRMQTRDDKCLEEASLLTSLHNKFLSTLLLKLEMQMKGFQYSLFDFESELQQRIDYPSKHGFKEGKMACCGRGKYRGFYSCGGKRPKEGYEFELCENSNDFVFWDSYHLTERAYKQLADEMWNGLQNFFHQSKAIFQI
ncbi:GDSL esterase/lipase 5-like [Mercurialis annua]|uniref:GDSL esterase/lipase 5-like n=1 Tax=Mercurialis annua TaxID=3986 RepID=UPI00215DF5DE|nr:GDSL esterase/lipase 5-like [Mercurialis annua]